MVLWSGDDSDDYALELVMRVDAVKPRRADIERAIEIVAESRRSHEQWVRWYERHSAEEIKYTDMVGDSAWHRQRIADYDHALSVLRLARDSMPGVAGPARCEG
jgi:hypothetical protein